MLIILYPAHGVRLTPRDDVINLNRNK